MYKKISLSMAALILAVSAPLIGQSTKSEKSSQAAHSCCCCKDGQCQRHCCDNGACERHKK